MKIVIIFLFLIGCQSIESKLEGVLENEYGKGVTLVSYRKVGDNYLDTIRLRLARSDANFFEQMGRLKGDQAISHAKLDALSGAVIPGMKGFYKDDVEKYKTQMNLYFDSLIMMIRLDSVICERIKKRQDDVLKFFHVKGVKMSGDTVWGLYDEDFRVVKVRLQ